MTVKECYERLNGNYDDAKSRLMNDRLIEKFMLKFPMDDSMKSLLDALASADYEQAFLSAHTLKGVAGNLAFSALQASSSALTEQLRSDKSAPDSVLVETTKADYDRVLNALRKYQDDKQ